MYNANCMNQMEYRYTYSGNIVMAYSTKGGANDQYIFTAGSGGIAAASLPKGAVDCRDLKLNDDFVDAVNKLSRQMYVVQQTQTGYVLMPIISALRITRNGSYYFFRSLNYTFALDTTNLMYESNLSGAGSPSYVYFSGLQIRNCRFQYTFKREPTKANMEKSDFDFVPGIGITSERTGLTSSQQEANQVRLWAINGMPLDDYIASSCGAKVSTSTKPSGSYTNFNGPFPEPDKEKFVGNPQFKPTTTSDPRPMANCPEQPGAGYHIVQPGESLMAISRTYGVPVKSLIAWNNIKNPDKINVCQKVYLTNAPASSKTVAKTPPAYVAQPRVQAQTPAASWQQPTTTSGDLPNLYSYQDPNQYPAVYQYATPQNAPAGAVQQTTIHVVQPGETFIGIARKYGYTEDRFRKMNNLPEQGNILLTPGMQLVASDCNCNPLSPNYKSTPAPATTSPNYNALTPSNIDFQQPAQYYTPTTTTPSYSPPSLSREDQFFETSVLGNTPQPGGSSPNNNAQKRTPSYQEYIVQQGDTINSIAIRFRASAQEIALTNGKDVNETLIAGQRLLIPK